MGCGCKGKGRAAGVGIADPAPVRFAEPARNRPALTAARLQAERAGVLFQETAPAPATVPAWLLVAVVVLVILFTGR